MRSAGRRTRFYTGSLDAPSCVFLQAPAGRLHVDGQDDEGDAETVQPPLDREDELVVEQAVDQGFVEEQQLASEEHGAGVAVDDARDDSRDLLGGIDPDIRDGL